MDQKTLRKLQLVETDMLLDIDRFCRRHQIEYSLFAGTALGAVRHAGFIPWDDDADIAMTCDNFNRFCATWTEHPIDGYFLQNADTDITCGNSHTKIRKNNTLILGEGEYSEKGHNGIWIDIFIWNKVPDSIPQMMYIYWNTLKSLVYTRGYAIGLNETGWRCNLKKILHLIPEETCKRKMKKITQNLQKYKELTSNYHWMPLCCMFVLKAGLKFPLEIADYYTDIVFEGQKLKIFKDYKKMLTIQYGDYMKLPPKEEQICKHKPSIIEFE